MRLFVSVLLAVCLVTPALAQRELPPLTKRQTNLLKQMSNSMGRQLTRAHKRSGDKTFAAPKVALDLAHRQIVITNRLNRRTNSAMRKAIEGSLRDRRASLCAVMASKRIRRTGVALVLRAEMRGGDLIARAEASALTCN